MWSVAFHVKEREDRNGDMRIGSIAGDRRTHDVCPVPDSTRQRIHDSEWKDHPSKDVILKGSFYRVRRTDRATGTVSLRSSGCRSTTLSGMMYQRPDTKGRVPSPP